MYNERIRNLAKTVRKLDKRTLLNELNILKVRHNLIWKLNTFTNSCFRWTHTFVFLHYVYAQTSLIYWIYHGFTKGGVEYIVNGSGTATLWRNGWIVCIYAAKACRTRHLSHVVAIEILKMHVMLFNKRLERMKVELKHLDTEDIIRELNLVKFKHTTIWELCNNINLCHMWSQFVNIIVNFFQFTCLTYYFYIEMMSKEYTQLSVTLISTVPLPSLFYVLISVCEDLRNENNKTKILLQRLLNVNLPNTNPAINWARPLTVGKNPAIPLRAAPSTRSTNAVPAGWRQVFVTGLAPDTTNEEVEKYLSSLNFSEISLVRVDRPKDNIPMRYASYRFQVPADRLEYIVNPDLWPPDVRVKEWLFRPRRVRSNDDGGHQEGNGA
ncbi:hypothetical protein DMENIID0001_088240 [Sergentomyia squamirostris]